MNFKQIIIIFGSCFLCYLCEKLNIPNNELYYVIGFTAGFLVELIHEN